MAAGLRPRPSNTTRRTELEPRSTTAARAVSVREIGDTKPLLGKQPSERKAGALPLDPDGVPPLALALRGGSPPIWKPANTERHHEWNVRHCGHGARRQSGPGGAVRLGGLCN